MPIPKNDAEYSEWLNRYNAYVNAHYATLGLTAEQTTVLDLQHAQWDTDYGAHTTAQAAAKTATRTKVTTRKATDDLLKTLNKIIQACPTTTDTDREALGLTIYGTGTSGLELSYVDKPQPDIDIREHLTHNIKVRTWTPEGVVKAKPAGVMGCEVVRTIGTRPASQEEMELVGTMPGTKFAFQYDTAQLGQQAHYAMRWIMRDGTPGSWSDIVSATIAA